MLPEAGKRTLLPRECSRNTTLLSRFWGFVGLFEECYKSKDASGSICCPVLPKMLQGSPNRRQGTARCFTLIEPCGHDAFMPAPVPISPRGLPSPGQQHPGPVQPLRWSPGSATCRPRRTLPAHPKGSLAELTLPAGLAGISASSLHTRPTSQPFLLLEEGF